MTTFVWFWSLIETPISDYTLDFIESLIDDCQRTFRPGQWQYMQVDVQGYEEFKD
jgi:hypothetical protein